MIIEDEYIIVTPSAENRSIYASVQIKQRGYRASIISWFCTSKVSAYTWMPDNFEPIEITYGNAGGVFYGIGGELNSLEEYDCFFTLEIYDPNGNPIDEYGGYRSYGFSLETKSGESPGDSSTATPTIDALFLNSYDNVVRTFYFVINRNGPYEINLSQSTIDFTTKDHTVKKTLQDLANNSKINFTEGATLIDGSFYYYLECSGNLDDLDERLTDTVGIVKVALVAYDRDAKTFSSESAYNYSLFSFSNLTEYGEFSLLAREWNEYMRLLSHYCFYYGKGDIGHSEVSRGQEITPSVLNEAVNTLNYGFPDISGMTNVSEVYVGTSGNRTSYEFLKTLERHLNEILFKVQETL